MKLTALPVFLDACITITFSTVINVSITYKVQLTHSRLFSDENLFARTDEYHLRTAQPGLVSGIISLTFKHQLRTRLLWSMDVSDVKTYLVYLYQLTPSQSG